MSKVYVSINIDLIIDMDSGTNLSDIINEMDYNFSDTTGNATIVDSIISDYTVKDSK
jgi:hypothetical protein